MPIFFICFIVFIIWFRVKSKQATTNIDEQNEDFWTREQKANFSRKTDISDLEYISIPENALPYSDTPDEQEAEIQNKIRELSAKKILNLTGISNTDLKLKYGRANLDILIACDHNFMQLIHYLGEWGNLLFDKEDFSHAKTVLEYAVSLGSDISGTYITLAKIYSRDDEIEKISALVSKLRDSDSLTKDSTVKQLENIIREY